jgi:hypothetical protein
MTATIAPTISAERIASLRTMIGQSKAFDITLINGETIHIKMPTAEQLLDFTIFSARIEEAADGEHITYEDLAPIMHDVTVFILQNNHEGVEITEEFLENNYLNNLGMQVGLMEEYSKFIKGIVTDPNS